MQQKTVALTKLTIYAIGLVAFVFLFGFSTDAAAGLCRDETGWKNQNVACDIIYKDPIGGSNLDICKYRGVLSNGTETLFTSATGNCSGSVATLQASISVGPGLHCQDNGKDACRIEFYAEDNAGNSREGLIVTLDIDYSPPSGGSISYANGFTSFTSVVVTVNDGTDDPGSGIDTSTRTVQRKEAALSNGICGAYGSFANVSVTSSYPFFINSDLVSGTCYQYQYLVSDKVGHQATYTSLSVVKVDRIAPTVTAFSINETSCIGDECATTVVITNSALVIDWTAPDDVGGSGIKRYEVWRAWDANGDGNLQSSEWDDSHPSSSIEANPIYTGSSPRNDNPPNGTYWYGIHAIDKAENCITEDTTFCPGGVTSDNETRIVLGPIKVIIVGNVSPEVFVVADPPKVTSEWQNTNAIASVGCIPAQGVADCDSNSYRLKIDPSAGICSENYEEYPPDTDPLVSSHRWVCAAAKDSAGIVGFSTNSVEFKVDKIIPTISGFDVNPKKENGLWVNVENPNVTISWHVQDDGASNSGLEEVQVWRSGNGGVDWEQITGSPFAAPSNDWDCTVLGDCAIDSPADGTYLYGIHVKDNAGNEITESESGFSPIEVQVDKTRPPKPTCTDSTSSENAIPVECLDTESGVTIRYTNDTDPTISSTIYTGTLTFEQTTTLKVAAWDTAGNRSLAPDNFYTYTIAIVPPPLGDGDGDGDGSSPPAPDTSSPILGTVTAVSSPTSDTTPNFTFHSTEAGTITYGGDCSSVTTEAIEGDNTITFDPLAEGLHDNCTITVTDAAGNISVTLIVNPFTIVAEEGPLAPNADPSVTSVSVAPNPIAANTILTFNVTWSDPNAGDQTKIYICKTDLLSGQTCSGGFWCESTFFSSSSPTSCTYTTQVQDAGTSNYFAFVCDDENACSSSQSGSFFVDITAPSILAFDVNPKKSDGLWVSMASPNVTINWRVKDDGANDAGLQEVQVWRSSNGGVSWEQILGSPFAAPSNDWTGFATDSPVSGSYLYGMHVKDNAANKITETEAGFSTIAVQVDKDDPTALIDAPTASWLRSSAQQQSFLKTTDEDLDSGINLSACTFEICSYEPNGTEHCKGTESRACSITGNTKEIVVGPGAAHCDFQGRNACDIFVDATDQAGNTGGSFVSYHVDWEFPVTGKLYTTVTEGEQTYPIRVQEDIPTTYKVHAQDTVELQYCDLYIDNIREQEAVLPPPGCTQDCVIEFENVFLPDPGSDHIYSNNYAVCFDSSLQGSQGQIVDIVIETFSIILIADPIAGGINTKFDLSLQVTGTAVGNASFKFDCTNDATWEYEIDGINLSVSDPGWVTRQGEKTKVTAPDTFFVKDLCQYSIPGIYTANSLAERGVSSAQDTLLINIEVSNDPEAILLQDNSNSADYCFMSAPPIILSWTFSDVDPEDNQSAYHVQIATNPGFGSPIIDTSKVQSANSEYSPLSLSFDSTYYWRVRVWDSLDNVSPFKEGVAFTTPDHAYPFPGFTWTPVFPLPGEPIQFQDETIFAPGSFNQSWLWSFGDGMTSSQQNPVHTYEESSVFIVNLTSSDDVGSCGGQGDLDEDGIPNEQDPDIDGDGIPNEQDPDIDGDGIPNGQDSSPSGQSGSGGAGGSAQGVINVTLPFPDWQEISPF